MTTPLWRNRDFTLLWTSQVASTIGTRVTSVAYPLLVLALTGSPTRAGVVAFAQTLPYLLLYLPGGAWVDRWPRRRLMVLCELGRAVALGSIAVVVVAGGLDAITLPQIAAVAFVEGSLFVLFDLAEGSALPQLVPAGQVPAAVAYNQGRIQAADLVGQPLGGALFSVAPGLPFAVDAASYLLSGGAIAAIRSRLQGERAPVTTRLREQVAEGLRFVWRDRFLRDSVALVGGINLGFNALTLVLIVRATGLGATPAQVGLMFGMYGAGGILGALVAARAHRAIPGRVLLVGISWLWAGLAAAYVLAPSWLELGLLSAVASVFGPIFNVVGAAAMYRVTPEGLLGRVRSASKLIAWGTIPLAGLLGGVLAEYLGTTAALLCVAALLAAVAALTTVSPGLRTLTGRPA
jgi:MFS family permease